MKVFVNATSRDLAAYRKALKQLLLEKEHQPSFLEDAPGSDLPSRSDFSSRIQDTDVVIAIYAKQYGPMRRGEETSILEQVDQLARQKGKKVITYLLDQKARWPEEFSEDDFIKSSRLETFTRSLESTAKPQRFHKVEDIIEHVTPLLHELSLIYDRQKHLHNWAKTLSPARKIQALQDLAAQKHTGRLSEGTFSKAADLIATDFLGNGPLPAELADDTELLLQGRLKAQDYRNAGAGSAFTGNIRHQLSRHIKPVLAVTLLGGLLAGFFLARPLLTSAANSTDEGPLNEQRVVGWLLDSRVNAGIQPGSYDPVKTATAVDGLRLLRSLAGEQELQTYAARLLGQIRNSNAGAGDVAILKANQALLKALCDSLKQPVFCSEVGIIEQSISTWDQRSASSRRVQSLLVRAENRTLREEERLTAYTHLLDSFASSVDTRKVQAQIEWLKSAIAARKSEAQTAQTVGESPTLAVAEPLADSKPSTDPPADLPEPAKNTPPETVEEPQVEEPPREVPDNEMVKALIAQVASDTLTINQALEMWEDLTGEVDGPARSYVRDEVRLLKEKLKTGASIKGSDNFVICREVDLETRQPLAISDRFNTGKIWMWARIFAPREEKITARWISNGKVYSSSTATVSQSYGYRIFFSKPFYTGNIGPNEVRIYNEDGLLIGRRTFAVVREPIPAEAPGDSLEAPAAATEDTTGNS